MSANRILGSFAALTLLGSALFVGGCAADAGESADTTGEDVITGSCPTKDATVKAALAGVAEEAARCSEAPTATPKVAGGWVHPVDSTVVSHMGAAHHRGRDSFYAPGDEQWVIGKFAYGPLDKDLKNETVDIFAQTGCAGAWENLGTATTTTKGSHATVEGVDDVGARVYFAIPEEKRLPIGHHRVRMVVRGDQTFADQFIEVLPKGTPIFISDVDGTLTERRPNDTPRACDEESDFPALWNGMLGGAKQPYAHEGASGALTKLTELGYRPLYLTARPEFLVPHTRAFLSGEARGDGRGDLPSGIVHTTLGLTGAINSAAQDFKMHEMDMLAQKGFRPQIGFGNRKSDVATYTAHSVRYAFFFENQDTAKRQCSQITDVPLAPSKLTKGNFRIESYVDAEHLFGALSPVCK
jgi:hypothetical protein